MACSVAKSFVNVNSEDATAVESVENFLVYFDVEPCVMIG